MKVKDYLKLCLEFEDEYNTSTAIMAFVGVCVLNQTAQEFIDNRSKDEITKMLAKIVVMLNEDVPDNMVQTLIKDNIERSKE